MKALVALMIAAGTLGWPAASARADHVQEGIGLRPLASELEDPTERQARYLVEHAAPGATIERTLEVYNGEEDGTEIRLFGEDAVVVDGAFRLAEGPGDAMADWIEVEPPSVRLAHGERRTVTVSIAVPPDAPDGERYGLVIAEPPAEASTDSLETITRVGLRVYLTVGEGAPPASDYAIESLTARRDADGAPVVRVDVRNTGGRTLDVTGQLRLSDGPGGVSAGPFPVATLVTLVPGATTGIDIPLSGELPAGPWHARVDLVADDIERSAEATIVFPDEAGTTSDPVAATPIYRDRGVLLPLALGLLVLALALVLLVWFLARRRRDEDDETDSEVGSATAVADH